MIYGLILAAGEQTRFELDKPMPLVTIHKKCLLDTIVENMSKVCDKIYVICSSTNHEQFIGDTYHKIIISPGKGSGDAIFKALKCISPKPYDTCFIQWGNSLQDPRVYTTLKKAYSQRMLIPCRRVEAPVTQIRPYKDSIRVSFSEYNEIVTPGYEDLHIYYGNACALFNKLTECIYQHLDRDVYRHQHNNKLEFFDVFNDTDLRAEILEVDFCAFSFNNINELKKIDEQELW